MASASAAAAASVERRMRHAPANVKDKADEGKDIEQTSSWQGGWNEKKWKETGNGTKTETEMGWDMAWPGMGWDGPRTRLPSLITILINLFK